MELDIESLRQWVGRQDSRSEVLTRSLVEKFNATFDRPSAASEGDVAPLLFHLCLAQPATPTSDLGPDGHASRGGFLPPVPLPRRMWAGGSFEFLEDIRVGDTITRQSSIIDVSVKQGRSGSLCFVTVEHRITSGERLAIVERQDIVYRGISGAAAATNAAAPKGVHQQIITPSSALLFRYSALTFNGHRIHYDSPYAKNIEGYSGLIVHGPLQATLLAHFAEGIGGKRPSRFSFRSSAPLFDDADFSLNAMDTPKGLKLWTSKVGGPIAMEALAEW